MTQMSLLEWWKTHFNSSFCKETGKKAIEQHLTAAATSALTECYSAYKNTKLRNQLGNEKAANLHLIFYPKC